MAGKSNYLAIQLLNHLFRTTKYTAPATVYIGLCTADPTDADITANELSPGVNGYSRASVTVADANWVAPTLSGSDQLITNTGVLSFGTATANLGTVTFFIIKDASTGGNLLYSGPLGTSRTISSGDPIQVPIGGIAIRET